MHIEITARHYDASDRVRNYVKEELARLRKFDHLITGCKVILDKTKEGELAEVNLHVSGKDLVASESSEDIIKSVDLAVEKMERQLKKFKGKRYSH